MGSDAPSANNTKIGVKIFENWYWIASMKTPECQLAFYLGIIEYGLFGTELTPPIADADIETKARFEGYMTAKASIDISKQKSIYGAIGGKQTQSRRQANAKQTPSKPQATIKHASNNREAEAKHATNSATSKAQAIKSKSKSMSMSMSKEKQQNAAANARVARARPQPPSRKEFIATVIKAGMPEDSAARIYQELVASDWRDGKGNRIDNWCKYAMAIHEEHKAKAPQVSPATGLYLNELGEPVNPNDNLI